MTTVPWVIDLRRDLSNMSPLVLSETGNSQIGENICPEIFRRVRRGDGQATMGFLDSTGDMTTILALEKSKQSDKGQKSPVPTGKYLTLRRLYQRQNVLWSRVARIINNQERKPHRIKIITKPKIRHSFIKTLPIWKTKKLPEIKVRSYCRLSIIV